MNGRKEVVEALLNVRGHTLIQPITHDTVLHAAISSQRPVIVEMILKVYLCIFFFFCSAGNSYVLLLKEYRCFQAFTHLVTTKNADGSTALHWASQCGSLDIVKLSVSFHIVFCVAKLLLCYC